MFWKNYPERTSWIWIISREEEETIKGFLVHHPILQNIEVSKYYNNYFFLIVCQYVLTFLSEVSNYSLVIFSAFWKMLYLKFLNVLCMPGFLCLSSWRSNYVECRSLQILLFCNQIVLGVWGSGLLMQVAMTIVAEKKNKFVWLCACFKTIWKARKNATTWRKEVEMVEVTTITRKEKIMVLQNNE